MKKLSVSLLIAAMVLAASFSAGAVTVYEPYAITTIAGLGNNVGSIDGPPDQAQFNGPQSTAVDKVGNVYVAEYWNQTIRQITPAGVVSTFAGLAGEVGSVDGKRHDARFAFPEGVAVAPDGSIYVADSFNQTIRKISRAGGVTTLAGLPGIAGFVDGIGSAARFDSPVDVTVNKVGEVIVADASNYAIRKIATDGTVTTFAGNGMPGSMDGTGTGAQFNWPNGVAVDKTGNIFVADQFNGSVRKITPSAVVTTYANFGSDLPTRVVTDRQLNVYATLGNEIDRVSTTGEVTFFAGGRTGSQDGTGADAEFGSVASLGIDLSGNIFAADSGNNTIRKIAPDATVTTFAGEATIGSRDGTGTDARFYYPSGMAIDATGTLYIADSSNHTIRKMTPDGVVTTVAGKAQTPGYVDANGADARFYYPTGMAVDSTGNAYVADFSNNVVRKITPAGDVTTIAGGYHFDYPGGVAVDVAGNVYVTATVNETIDKVAPDGTVTIYAGVPGKAGLKNGGASKARFDDPSGITIDSAGNLYVADFNNDAIRKITPDLVVSTPAGGAQNGSNDGSGQGASFRGPLGVAVDGAGNLYVTDENNDTIRKVTPGGLVTTLAGSPLSGGWVDGTGGDARMTYPHGIAVDGSGNIYVADLLNNTIREGTSAP